MKERKTKKGLVGMDDLENCDDTSTEMPESKMDQNGLTVSLNSVGTGIRSGEDGFTWERGEHMGTRLSSEDLDDSYGPEPKSGFTGLKICGDFSTAMLASTFTQTGIIDYNGNISTQPDQYKQQRRPSFQEERKRTRKGNHTESFDDELLDH